MQGVPNKLTHPIHVFFKVPPLPQHGMSAFKYIVIWFYIYSFLYIMLGSFTVMSLNMSLNIK